MDKGISEDKVQALREKYGLNVIKDLQKKTFYRKLIEQNATFLNALLVCGSIISFSTGEKVDGYLILSVLVVNGAFGLYQEHKADQAVASLKKMTIRTIRVVRDGIHKEIDARYLVPEDIIFLEEGTQIPADCRLIDSMRFEVNEAALTGESLPIAKAKEDEVFMGTVVAKGRAWAQVTHIGMKTKFGLIANQLQAVEEAQTPLQQRLAHLSEILGLVGIVLSVVVFILSQMQGSSSLYSFLLASSLAVAIVPESLPAIMTVILSIGVKHMASRGAIIRKLSAIEALGSTTLIATDKTGTLTENNMSVKEIYVNQRCLTSQEGLETVGKYPEFLKIMQNSILCSTATLARVHDDGRTFEALGDPTEGALLIYAKEAGFDSEVVRQEWKILDEQPFDSISKRMSVAVQKEGDIEIFVKGSFESILEVSSYYHEDGKRYKMTDEKKNELYTVMKEWARHGLRVIAFASSRSISISALHGNDHTFYGMVALHDPPRKEARAAIQKALHAGITVVMITGDNERTAEAVGSAVGLIKKGEVIVTGTQLDTYSDDELIELIPHVKIFARTTPLHKARIVELYQKRGEIVVVTGDGVNDAVALKQADVGVAMGKIGTDVARDTADVIITDDNFATIVESIEEGRTIVKRLRKSIMYLLTGNFAEAISLVVGLFIGFPPLYLPIQLLYLNLVTDSVPALAFALNPHDSHVMRKPPEHPMRLLRWGDYGYILTTSTAIAAIVIVAAGYGLMQSEIGMRTAALSVMAIIQAFLFVDVWIMHLSTSQKLQSMRSNVFLLTTLIPIFLQIFFMSIPGLASKLHIQYVHIVDMLLYLAYAALIFPLIWIFRVLSRSMRI